MYPAKNNATLYTSNNTQGVQQYALQIQGALGDVEAMGPFTHVYGLM